MGITYGIYRWVDPEWAAQLTYRIQNYFDKNDTDQTQDELSSNDTGDQYTETGDVAVVTSNTIYTGTLDTGGLVELDYVLTDTDNEEQDPEEQEEVPEAQPEESWDTDEEEIQAQSTTTQTSSSTTTTSSSLSAQDKQDMKNFLNAIVE